MDSLRDTEQLAEIKKYKADLTIAERLQRKQLRIQALDNYLKIAEATFNQYKNLGYSNSSLISLKQKMMLNKLEKEKLEEESLFLLGDKQYFSPGS